MLFSVHYRHMTGAVYILKAHPTFLEKMKNIHTHTHAHTYTKRHRGTTNEGATKFGLSAIGGFQKSFFLDWFKASLVGHYCGWKNTGPTHDAFDLDTLV